MDKLEQYQNMEYKMVIEHYPDEKVYFVEFPELPGCIAHGKTEEEAVKKALSVKNEWLATAFELGWTIPVPAPKIIKGRWAPKVLFMKVLITVFLWVGVLSLLYFSLTIMSFASSASILLLVFLFVELFYDFASGIYKKYKTKRRENNE